MKRRLSAAALALLVFAGAAHANVRAFASAVRTPELDARAVELRLDDNPDGDAQVRLKVDSVQPAGADAQWTRIALSCALARKADGSWRCAGRLTARSGDAPIDAAVALSSDPDDALATLDAGAAKLAVGGTPAQRRFTAHAFPVAWLRPVLELLLKRASASGGTLDANLTRARDRFSGDVALHALDLDSPAGDLATGKLEARVRVAPAGEDTKIAATLSGGEWLVAPVYVKLDGAPVELEATLAPADGGGTAVTRFSWNDPNALKLEAHASFDADGAPATLVVDSAQATFPAAFARYLGPVLAPSGYGTVSVTGAASATLDWRRDAEPAATMTAADLKLEDANGRFALDGLALDLAVNKEREAHSTIAWKSARLYRVPIGAASAAFDLAPAHWKLVEPLAVPALGGELRLERLTRERPDAAAPARWEGAVGAKGISLEQLSAAIDWPRFTGTLDADLPAFRSDGVEIHVDGALTMQAFGGKAELSHLTLERPFGVAPSLAADLRFDDVDLEKLTGALEFGSITGRLDGRIDGLRLVDWSPVTLDAELRTDDSYDGPKRISQRAVKSLSLLGGGGVPAGIVKVFETFSYDAIGLHCRLERNVCHMDGLDAGSGGYTIVRGAGLPRLTVIGHQREVDWPVLVSRLRSATVSTTPP